MTHSCSISRWLICEPLRSNVDLTYSMMKAKFGDSLRSKTDTAMVNEALCKVLCHNLCCVIQSTYELGVEATFWDEAEAEKTADPSGIPVLTDLIDVFAWA